MAKRSNLGLIIGRSSTCGKVFDAKRKDIQGSLCCQRYMLWYGTPVPAIYAVDEHLRYGMIKIRHDTNRER